jgi:hypothetical protein
MIVLDAVGHPEAGGRTEIAVLEDDSLREADAGMRFGARDWIPDRAAVDVDVLTASHPRPDAIEREIVRDGVRPVHLRPRPAEDCPGPPDFPVEKCFNRRALRGICALVDEDKGLAVALVDRAGPVGVDGEVQPIQLDVARGAIIDVPRPASFTFARGRPRVEVARTAPVAVARDEDSSLEVPAFCHVKPRFARDDRLRGRSLSRTPWPFRSFYLRLGFRIAGVLPDANGRASRTSFLLSGSVHESRDKPAKRPRKTRRAE